MVRKLLELTDNDLIKNQFKYDEEQIIYTLQTSCPSLRILNRFQKLTAYVCAKYIIFGGNDEKYGDCVEDRWLDDNDILQAQPHITREELSQAHKSVFIEEESEKNELAMMCKNDFAIF